MPNRAYTSTQMRAAILAVAILLSATATAQDPYPLTPDSEVQNVPHGTVEKLTLPAGRFYPGTPHTVSIYLPPNPGAEPLPYMVFLDGSGYLGGRMRAATVFDNLIAKKQLPPMAGIFIDPGVLPAIRPDAQNRYERVFEYDSLSNRYVNFLLQEVIPFVEKKHALSKDPNGHAIGGTSTGAVGAFVAAWHRPDQFRRVLSLIGTYVAMKGADTLPELVRKTEPRPIRIWLQDGANDHITADEPYGTFYAGTWPRANQLLYDALQFGGYDTKLTIGTGGHDTKQGSAELPEALKWLWRDYTPEKGVGKIEVHPPTALNTARFDKRGSIWSTVDAIGNWERLIEGQLPQQGSRYAVRGVSIIWSDATAAKTQHGLSIEGFIPSTAATSPDQAMLVLTDRERRHQWSMQLDKDGKPTNPEPFYRLEVLDEETGATGAAFDSLGQVYFATKIGVQIAEANGRIAMILNSPIPDEPIEDIAFGGPDHDWLYVTVQGKLFRRKMKTHAVPADKPEKPPQPPL